MIDEQEKNESRMGKTVYTNPNKDKKERSKNQPRNGFSAFKPSRASSLTRENQRIVERLTFTSEPGQSKLRDRHGNRTNLLENQE